jgi:hypothetical protein
MMTYLSRVALSLAVVGAGMLPSTAVAQASQKGQPKTAFAIADIGKLRWLEGTWKATAPGEREFYERYRFVNDSTIEITYYGDSTFSRETGNGRVYLSVGRVYHTSGPGRWGATTIDTSGIYFVPQVNAHNTFSWSYQSKDAWTATMRSGYSGRERVTVYQLQRVKPPTGP